MYSEKKRKECVHTLLKVYRFDDKSIFKIMPICNLFMNYIFLFWKYCIFYNSSQPINEVLKIFQIKLMNY